MRSLPRVALVAMLAVTVGGCALQASPADGLRFEAPAGWRASPGILGYLQFWRPPNNDREVLMLFKSPRPMQTNEIFSKSNLQDTMKDVTIVGQQTIKICGTQPAKYVQARGSSSEGGPIDIETVATIIGGSSYFAVYVRPIVVRPNPKALAALREVCPKP
ncbi:MAG TPA: hypothetical protein VNU22_01675 [Candidatus Acidoferrum sp.]|jgi:hypothetical protein|nr:hypothetical protein [Candidatus Acidoferrum sp.]